LFPPSVAQIKRTAHACRICRHRRPVPCGGWNSPPPWPCPEPGRFCRGARRATLHWILPQGYNFVKIRTNLFSTRTGGKMGAPGFLQCFTRPTGVSPGRCGPLGRRGVSSTGSPRRAFYRARRSGFGPSQDLTRGASRHRIQSVCALRGARLPAMRRIARPSRPIILMAISRNRAVRSSDRIRAVSFSHNRHSHSIRREIASLYHLLNAISRDELARNGDEA
jgi:hypothetical protein